ncbi:protein of unknown function [Methylorubrum extorquens DM4]|uniref:Uncharacterized protein n=1 Tax=Methylorubrum extorquens (strain DSM 6343 / CIP 106787 / DM4) TaxID=661410 RepID=C7CHK5_METED|nr:protein of unknown function [Methylorubrum extorquens DM4]
MSMQVVGNGLGKQHDRLGSVRLLQANAQRPAAVDQLDADNPTNRKRVGGVITQHALNSTKGETRPTVVVGQGVCVNDIIA